MPLTAIEWAENDGGDGVGVGVMGNEVGGGGSGSMKEADTSVVNSNIPMNNISPTGTPTCLD